MSPASNNSIVYCTDLEDHIVWIHNVIREVDGNGDVSGILVPPFNTFECGIKNEYQIQDQTDIVSGYNAKRVEWPWMVGYLFLTAR